MGSLLVLATLLVLAANVGESTNTVKNGIIPVNGELMRDNNK